MSILTRFLVISDTHGEPIQRDIKTEVDVAIHCGDLTEGSKLEEFKEAISLMRNISAKLKLVIAGNHDFTLDDSTFAKKLNELNRISGPIDDALIKREYGKYGDARRLFNDARGDGIIFLDEGRHELVLHDGARLNVFASPYTPSTDEWAFQYDPKNGHDWQIDGDIDVVITHGPPQGILDRGMTGNERLGSVGCPGLLKAVARVRPRMHCFGHVHRSWGAKMVTWKDIGDNLSYFTAIDNDKSKMIESLASKCPKAWESEEEVKVKLVRWDGYRKQGYCMARSKQATTMFVNAAIKGEEEQQLPWVVEIDLPRADVTSDEVESQCNQSIAASMPGSRKRKATNFEPMQRAAKRHCLGISTY